MTIPITLGVLVVLFVFISEVRRYRTRRDYVPPKIYDREVEPPWT